MKKVLYVDDEIINRKIFSKYMEDYDVEATLMDNGNDALKVMEEEQFDLVFLDHIMPEITGLELLMAIQSMELSPNTYTPFIALTANPIENAEDLYLDAGFSAYMKKPIEKGAMESVMSRFLPGSKKSEAPKEPVPAGAGKPEGSEETGSQSTDMATPDAKTIEEMFYGTEAAQNGPKGEAAPIWMESSDILDFDEGVRINGSKEGYFDTLRIFKNNSRQKIDQLEEAFSEMNIPDYGILTHSLKSAATIIGAGKLANYAEFMEKACNNGDEETLKVDHGDFIKEYKKVVELLSNNLTDFLVPDIGHLEYEQEGLRRLVLLISSKENISTRAMENHLREGRCKVETCPPYPELAGNKVEDAELVVFNMDDTIYERKDLITFFKERCVESGKGLILVGEVNDYEYIKKEMGENYITDYMPLPLDISAFMKSINHYFDNYEVRSRLRHRILLVDDDEIYTSTIERWLSGLYDIDVAGSAVEAISRMERKKPDVLLLDYAMPVTDGAQFLEYLRKDEATAGISVIFLTGSQDRNSVMKVVDLSPQGYLLKSIDKNTLIERLETFFVTGSLG